MARFPLREQGAIDERELQAYVDGRLSAARRRAVEAHLAAHPEDAVRVDAYRRQLALLQDLASAARAQPAASFRPELLRALAEQLRRRRRRRFAAAAAVALLVAGASLATVLLPVPDEPSRQLADVRDDPAWVFHSALMAEPAADPVAAEAADSVAWLRDRMAGRELRRPDLEALGLRFVSSSVLHHTEPPVIRLIYEDEMHKRLFIYVAVLLEDTEGVFGVVPEGYVSLQWRRGPVVFALIAPSDSPQLVDTMQVVSASLVDAPLSEREVVEAAPSHALGAGLENAAVGSDHPAAAPPAPRQLEPLPPADKGTTEPL